METAIEKAIVEQPWIDRAADAIQDVIVPVLYRAPRVADALHGEWLGHPLHAAMTDIPIGAWFTGFVLDMTEVLGNTHKLRRGADAAIVVGLVGALGAAVAGLADWSETRGDAKRIGFVHAATNTVIAGLYGASLVARASKRRGLGIGLSSVGYGLLIFSSWLGGQLAYRLLVGVRPDALEQAGEGLTPELEETFGAEARGTA